MKNLVRIFKKQQGFTLIEVMVVVAVIATLAAIAAPSFAPLMERWRVRGAAEDLQASIHYARSEAIKRGGNVTIGAADGSSWANGWAVSSGTDVLQAGNASNSLAISEASNQTSLSFNRWGVITPAANFLFTPAGKGASDPSAVRLCINSSGRILRRPGSGTCS